MPQTYTSGTLSVSNGEITSHDTTTVAEGITILSAECRWQGVETTEQETSYDHQTATNSASVTGFSTTLTKSATNSDSAEGGANVVVPSPPSGYSFKSHEWEATVSNTASVQQTASGTVYEPDGTSTDFSETLNSGETVTIVDVRGVSTNYVSDSFALVFDSGGGEDNATITSAASATTVGEDTSYGENGKTVSFPSVPSGYSFDYQSWDISVENTRSSSLSGTIDFDTPDGSGSLSVSLSGGQSTIVEGGTAYSQYSDIFANSDHPDLKTTLVAETTGEDSNTYTVTYDTDDPFVTRDVDGSYTGTLDDGVWSSWVTLDGLSTGVNEFYHNISGSGEANFEFRYDWEYKFPEPVGGLLSIGSRDGAELHRVALADPTSDRLAYNHVRVLVGGTVYAIDVVDPSDPDAIDWLRIGTQHGVVCPRAYQTESV